VTAQRLPVAVKRRITRVSVMVCFACLAAQAVGVRLVHHSLPATLLGMVLPVTGALTGLLYLRSTRGRP
jgi:hypothetical protein